MARKISDIQNDMITALTAEIPNLSTSKVALWRVWTHVVAVAIHTFELILDMFLLEMESKANTITAGSKLWYVEQAKRFQNGDTLLFNTTTVAPYYINYDTDKQIVKIVAISVANRIVFIKVATKDDNDKIIPLTADELHNFKGYISCVKFASDMCEVISTTADEIKYSLEVYYDAAVPLSVVKKSVDSAIDAYKYALSFDAQFYSARFIAAIMAVDGVITVKSNAIERRGSDTHGDYLPIDVFQELHSGYFDYSTESTITYKSAKDYA